MRVEEFSKGLYQEMETLTEGEDTESMEGARNVSGIMLQLIDRLRGFISNYHFENINEEIHFFKNIKPKFFTRLLYARKIFEILSGLPLGLLQQTNAYYLKKLSGVQKYIDSNKDFILYYRCNSAILDEIYFVRRTPDLWQSLTSEEWGDDIFTTLYDQKLSKIRAYEKVSTFLIESINKAATLSSSENTSITWTGSKAALIELLYALQTNGSCNNGAMDVKTLASHFEYIFNVKLGNFYRTFQEIRIRKISRTTFLDQLKEGLIKRMDQSDENPKW